ncbi:MAG: hypothetical protein U0350_38090 [Caldilineaceae bacterium]
MNTSAQHYLHPPTHLFTVRLWMEEFGHGEGEVRIQVKHVLSGETHYFREWEPLITYLLVKMEEVENDASSKGADA